MSHEMKCTWPSCSHTAKDQCRTDWELRSEGYIAARAADLLAITSLRAENERLRAALRAAYEVYAGSEGFIPETCAEGYQQQIIKQMVSIINAALSGADAPDPWRPIETAPKDGKRLLLAYQTPFGKWRRVIAFYAPKLAIETNNDDGSDWYEYDEANDRYCLPEGWYECIENWDDYSSVHMSGVEPSHWAPLPPPPKKDG